MITDVIFAACWERRRTEKEGWEGVDVRGRQSADGSRWRAGERAVRTARAKTRYAPVTAYRRVIRLSGPSRLRTSVDVGQRRLPPARLANPVGLRSLAPTPHFFLHDSRATSAFWLLRLPSLPSPQRPASSLALPEPRQAQAPKLAPPVRTAMRASVNDCLDKTFRGFRE